MTSLFPTNLVFDEFKIKVVEFGKFTTNFQIKPLQTTKRSYLVTKNPFNGGFHNNLVIY